MMGLAACEGAQPDLCLEVLAWLIHKVHEGGDDASSPSLEVGGMLSQLQPSTAFHQWALELRCLSC